MYSSVKECVKDILLMTFATGIVAASVFFFLVPSHAAVSSVSGLAIVLTNFVPLSMSQITGILNIVLLIIGFIFIGKEFGFKTVYTTILMPVFLGIFEKILPNNKSLTGDATLDVLCYVVTVSVGLSILFNDNASSGGLDIVAMLINKYLHIELGKAMTIAGICVALSSAAAYDTKIVILSLLGTYANGIVLDHFIFGHNIKRRVCIISEKQEIIREFILKELHSGATLYEATGAYDMIVRNELITILDKNEYRRLMNYIVETDPKAFVTVYTVSEMRYIPKK
ncbi:Uncharacterized membrane-anchored protein YitT, contains DUF161 and DUF2179 domains [Lachnospiraceae bacterium KH1T2]|nr:Uncharacterized membrane-anchored protein YitT, contains DUF161 and DUF2179 domains [Lachnospiraceae bacterium KH1T2]